MMNLETGLSNWPLSMEHHETWDDFAGIFGEDMFVDELKNPFQPTTNCGSLNNSFNGFISSCFEFPLDAREICRFLDNNLSNEKLLDDCFWIDDKIKSNPVLSPSASTLGDGSSSSSFQSNCSWTNPSLCQSNPEEKAIMSPSTNSSITTASDKWEESQIAFDSNSLDVNGHPGFIHLIKAFGEAKKDGFLDLVEAISNRILEIVSPLGSSSQRMGYYMFQSSETQSDYIRLESMKLSKVAFQAFSTLCLFNLFPILAANATILSSIPAGTEAVHIIDFDTRDGSQWLPFLEAVGSTKLVRITSVRWGSGDEYDYDQSCSRFVETKKHLLQCAKSSGWRLVVNEMGMEEILLEKKRMKKRGGNEFLVVNCVLGLPQIGQQRTLKQAIDFMNLSQEILENSANRRGIITWSNSIPGAFTGKTRYDFASWFDECVMHSKALFAATGWHFPSNQIEARTAIESLVLGPLVSSNTRLEKWEEMKEVYHEFPGLVKQELSNEILCLTRELVRGQGLYETKMERHGLILEWAGTPLVRFSAWR